MTKRNAISKQLLIGLVGLSMAVATGAYSAEPDSASTVPAQSPITEVPQSPAESLQSPAEAPQSPSTASPIVGEESANATLDQVVASSSSLTTLNAAIIAAGLEATLSGVGPYTVLLLAMRHLPPFRLERWNNFCCLRIKLSCNKLLATTLFPAILAQQALPQAKSTQLKGHL